jgi:hypothetical protein
MRLQEVNNSILFIQIISFNASAVADINKKPRIIPGPELLYIQSNDITATPGIVYATTTE